MKVVVNRDAQRLRLSKMVKDILETAVAEGSKGNRYFTYNTGYSREEMFSVGNVTDEVYKLSEGTVRCCARGDRGYSIDFEIVD
jgi:hypothetical protein